MDWDRVAWFFFASMSLATAGYLYDRNTMALFIAASIHLISTFFKIGVKNILSAKLFASSLVEDLHLIPAFIYAQRFNDTQAVMTFVLIESAKTKEEF